MYHVLCYAGACEGSPSDELVPRPCTQRLAFGVSIEHATGGISILTST
jgi:hypothetical protein